jgi:hypothetical protein
MQTTLRMETTVLPGHRVQISAPELPEGAKVEVIVVLPEKLQAKFASALEFLESPRRELTPEMLLRPGREEQIDAGFVGELGAFEIYRGKRRGHRMANLRLILR